MQGHFKGIEVAVKVFHSPLYQPAYLVDDDQMYPNIGSIENLIDQSKVDQDKNDTEQKKVS